MSKTKPKNFLDVDIITLEVIRSMLEAIPGEMAVTMRRTSYHPIFNEINDFSCAIFDDKGDMVAQHAGVQPHLGSMELCVKAAIGKIGKSNLKPGDVIIHNDPYLGGTHLPDVTVVMPIFHEGELLLFPANRGHHGDIGGFRPGSFSGECTSIFQEGLRIPPIKLYEGGSLNEEAFDIILANVRVPDFTKGDINAQVASCRTAEKRLREIFEKYGSKIVRKAASWAMDYSERRMRTEIDRWPDRAYEFDDYLDSDGINLDRPVRIHVRITVQGSDITFDYSKSDPQVTGPMNASYGVLYASTLIALLNATDYTIPINHGCYRPISIIAPEGLVVNPRFPAALVGGNTETECRIIDAIWAALAQFIPDKLTGADTGTTANSSAGGIDPRSGKQYVWYLSPPGSAGGRSTKDGVYGMIGGKIGGVPSHIPLEIFESRFPWFTEEHSWAVDSGGPGKFKGGVSTIWKIRPVNHTAEFVVEADRVIISPYGLFGGMPGLHGDWKVLRNCVDAYDPELQCQEIEDLLGKRSTNVSPKDLVYIRTPGSGGYGDPLERNTEAVRKDIAEGYVSIESAKRDYGVIIKPDSLDLDHEATLKLRRELRAEWRRDEIYIDQFTKPFTRRQLRMIRWTDLKSVIKDARE